MPRPAPNAMDDLSRAHIEWLERQKVKSPNTIASRARVLRSVGNAATATRDDLRAWWEERAARDLTPGTRAVDLAHLRAFYKWATIHLHRADDPSVILEAPRPDNALHRKVPTEDLVRLVNALPADLTRAVMLGACAGLRVSESAALDWADVDTADDVLLIRRSKGGKSRAVEVSPELIAQLAGDGTRGNVVTAGGQQFTASQLQRRLNRAMKAAGCDFTSHDLRHRWGITAYRVNSDLLAVAEMMGHSSVNTTKIYAQAASESKRRIASAVMF